MAAETRAANASVKDDLLARSERFGYFQAIRLLRLYDRNAGREPRDVRVRPKLGLNFPENDIDAIEVLPNQQYRVTANFFGLYGVASPLPTFYTEDLFEEEREGRHATREFLDIVHDALYPLLFDAWSKYRLQRRVVEERDEGALSCLYGFVGLADEELRASQLPGSAVMLRYAALLNQRPRSAAGLRTLLADAYADTTVEIESCVCRAIAIPDDQLWRLGERGHQLGETAHLGTEIDDCASQLRIRLSNVPYASFAQLLPSAPGHVQLRFLVRQYLIDPLIVEVEIVPQAHEIQPARIGRGAWCRLGFDTWLAPHGDGMPQGFRYLL